MPVRQIADVVPEPVGIPADDPVWRVPWLIDLIDDMPATAVWPRLMTAPHPRAVGSLGVEFEWWVRTHRALVDERIVQRQAGMSGMELLWFQRLVARRLLEVDAEGRLVWITLILTLARQLGKSWLLQLLLAWRLHQGARFGRAQRIVHISIQAGQVEDVMAPEIAIAEARPDLYDTLDNNNGTEIEWLADGSKWVRSTSGTSRKGGAYGQSGVGAGVVDEAWSIRAVTVDDGLEPTILRGVQPWLLLISTAHRLATTLMLSRRAVAAEDLRTAAGGLLIEWSTPREFALDDPAGWRLASPDWTEQRELMIRDAVDRAISGLASTDPDEPDPIESVRAQYMNQWPTKLARRSRVESLFTAAAWANAEAQVESVGPLYLAVEDAGGEGAAAAAAGVTEDGLVELGGWSFARRSEAYEWVASYALARPGSQLLIGGAIADDPELVELGVSSVTPRGAAATRSALALLRELISDGRAVHDGLSGDLSAQMTAARVTKASGGGLLLVNEGDLALVRAAAWVVAAAERQASLVPTVHGA